MPHKKKPPEGTGPLTFADAYARLTDKQKVWVASYLRCFNKTQAARDAKLGKTELSNRQQGLQTSRLPAVMAAIEAGFREAHMTPAEIIARLEAQASADLAEFYFPVEYEVDVFESVSLRVKLDHLRKKHAIAEDLRDRFEDRAPILFEENKLKALRLEQEIFEVEVALSENPNATFEAKTGTRMETRWEIDIIKAREAGLSHLLQEISYDQRGQPKLKLADKVRSQELLGKYHKLWVDRTEHTGNIELEVSDAKQRLEQRLAKLAQTQPNPEPPPGVDG